MPWAYILRLLGPGLHWNRRREDLLAAIADAERDNNPAAAEHIRIILQLRDEVMMYEEKDPASVSPPGQTERD